MSILKMEAVSFRYPVRESEDITITVPEGFRVEAVPAAAHSERSFAVYALAASVENGSKIRIARAKGTSPPATSPSV